MADKYVNEVGLGAVKAWVKGLVSAVKGDVTTLEGRVDTLVAEGGEPNVIESVKVNGTALTPDANKAVDVTVPTTVAALTDANDYATKAYVAENGGTIQSVKVNGTEQTITNHAVDITVPTTVAALTDASNYALASSVPTATSALTNDSGYQTASDVSTAISTAVSSVYRYKGSVAKKANLPTDAAEGDVYDVQSNGVNYAWTGTKWDELGSEFDATLLWAKEDLVAMTVAEVNAILEAE